MSGNVLVWSCSRSKFARILGESRGDYREKIGWKCNSLWYIQISQCSAGSSKYDDPSHFMDWYINVMKEHETSYVEVLSKIISGNKVLISTPLYFSGSAGSHCSVGKCTASRDVDLVLTFPKYSDTNDIISERSLLSKTEDLLTDFQKMFKTEQLADVTLKCKASVIKVHKCILSARSLVFAAMFSSPMQEYDTDTVIIDDMKPEILSSVLNFLYCGQVSIDSLSIAQDLLYAAEKYQIKALKEGCVSYCKSVLTFQNAIKILKVADLYDRQLKKEAKCCIKDHMADLKNSEEWINLKSQNPALALEVCSINE